MNKIVSEQKHGNKYFYRLPSTIFKAHETTNIRYRISDARNNPLSREEMNEINSITSGRKYIKRIAKIVDLGYFLDYDSFIDSTFKRNLQVIDSDLPKIIANVVLDKYVNRITKFTDIIDKLIATNPMNYDLSQGHNFYEYRLVNFLVEVALGMTSKVVWSGKYDVVGGIIIVKADSELLCYHLIDFNKFKQYLKTAARIDNPSGTKMNYGKVEIDERGSYIKLNFQIKA
ncbi:MAG: HpaII family restriction endonuclease [Cyclobacteriaceae bacterium]